MLSLKDAFKVRARRDDLMQLTLRWVEVDNWESLSEAEKQALRDYRQALRDLPEVEFKKEGVFSYDDVAFPVPPDFI